MPHIIFLAELCEYSSVQILQNFVSTFFGIRLSRQKFLEKYFHGSNPPYFAYFYSQAKFSVERNPRQKNEMRSIQLLTFASAV